MHSNTRTIKLNYSTTTNWIYINLKLTWDQKNFKNPKGWRKVLEVKWPITATTHLQFLEHQVTRGMCSGQLTFLWWNACPSQETPFYFVKFLKQLAVF